MVSLRFNLTRKEYYNYNYYTAWAAPAKKSFRVRYFTKVILLYAAVAGLYIISNRSHILWVDVSVFLAVGTVYFLLVPFFVRFSVHRRVNAILARKENQHVLEESEVILSDSGIIDRDRVSESRYSWDAITEFADTRDSYYLYTNSYHAIVIPKRTFTDNASRELAKQLFNKNLPLWA